jgi:integrase/recombinase XerD
MKQAKTLEARELKFVFAAIASRRYAARDRAIVALSFYAGLRAHEIASLTWGTILGADGQVLPEVLLHASQTKGNKARRVFLSQRLQKELTTYCRAHVVAPERNAPLFSTMKRRPFTANAMAHLFLDIYAEAGIAGASSHSGRRTFITNLAAKGVGVRVLASLAGHTSISTTQRYIDVNDTQLRAAVELG